MQDGRHGDHIWTGSLLSDCCLRLIIHIGGRARRVHTSTLSADQVSLATLSERQILSTDSLLDVDARQPSLRSTEHSKTWSRLKSHDTSRQDPTRPASQRSADAILFEDELGTMIEATAPKGRRERTFIGSECAVCEEPLEHTLRGERILQLSCSHVVHEACFYEYIKEFESQECPTCEAPLGIDTSRGGNLNFGTSAKLA